MTSTASVVAMEKQAQGYEGFIQAIRQAAKDGEKILKAVVDDYEYDSSRWSAGARKATALIGLRVRVECVFLLPVSAIPTGHDLQIDTALGRGCWLRGPGIDDDPADVMRLAFENQDKLLSEIVLEKLIGGYSFRSLRGLGVMSKRYRATDYAYRAGTDGLMVSFVAELESY